jgi:[ribosomal protein S18]-alanine N-acetyltransferase
MRAGEQVCLRAAHAGDVPDLVGIDAASPGGGWNADSFAYELGLAWSRIVVAGGAASSEVLGFIVYWVVAGETEILNLAVSPRARRRGLGCTLVEHVIAKAREAGASRVLLEVREGNAAARGLYHSLGFTVTGVRRGYYQRENEDAILMELRLV